MQLGFLTQGTPREVRNHTRRKPCVVKRVFATSTVMEPFRYSKTSNVLPAVEAVAGFWGPGTALH